jgi:hypothetical protein
MERPAGVTALAVLSIAFAIAVCLIGVLVLGWGALILRSGVDSWGLNKLFAVGGAIIAMICFAIAVLYAAIGRGLLRLQNWARIILIVFAALSLFSSAMGFLIIFGANLHSVATPPVSITFSATRFAISVVIDIWVLIYLSRPSVKQAFGATNS